MPRQRDDDIRITEIRVKVPIANEATIRRHGWYTSSESKSKDIFRARSLNLTCSLSRQHLGQVEIEQSR